MMEVTNFKPARGYVLVKRNENEKLASGIILPNQEVSMKATVVALGKGLRDDKGGDQPMNVKVGDVILLEMYQITEVKFGMETYILTKEETISCVFEGGNDTK